MLNYMIVSLLSSVAFVRSFAYHLLRNAFVHFAQVYWRDTRRAVGVNGFKLLHTQLRDNNASLPTGTRFVDSVAIGGTHRRRNCPPFSVCRAYTYATVLVCRLQRRYTPPGGEGMQLPAVHERRRGGKQAVLHTTACTHGR